MTSAVKYGRYLILFLAGCLTLLVISSMLAKIEAYYHSGRSLESAHPGFEVLRNDVPELPWVADHTGNSNDYIKQQISKQYRDGWMWLNSSIGSGDWRGVIDFYTTEMFDDLKRDEDSTLVKVEQTILKHNLTLKHLSIDYTLAVFTDSLIRYQCLEVDENTTHCSSNSHEIEVYMQLQDDRWKVFNWKEVESTEISTAQPELAPAFAENIEALRNMRGINYYPQQSPWKTFWSDYDTIVIEADFERIRALGLNTVRVFLSMADLGRNEINQETIKKLDHLIATAERNGLRVLPTLFDFPIGFEIAKFPTYIRQLEYIVDRYKEDPTIVAWNLKNEADLDFAAYSKEEITRWAQLMIGTYKSIDAQHPVTIGWAHIENVRILEEKLDYLSLHNYSALADLERLVKELDTSLKPLVIEEFGIPSNKSIWNLYQHNELKQEQKIKERISFYEEHNLPWLIWTLYDFDEAPSDVFGRNPLARDKQKGFGILNVDGKAKPIAAFISSLLSEAGSK